MEELSLLQLIKSDLGRLEKPTFLNFFKWYFFSKGSTFPYEVWMRVLHAVKKRKCLKYTIGLLVYFIERHYSFKYGIFVNSNINIGPGLKIVHGSGVFLNCSEIGENVTIYQGVTFGTKNNTDYHGKKEVPKVGNDVTVYTGAVVSGNVYLRDGCVVAANAFVNKDVEEGMIVAGLPARSVGKTIYTENFLF